MRVTLREIVVGLCSIFVCVLIVVAIMFFVGEEEVVDTYIIELQVVDSGLDTDSKAVFELRVNTRTGLKYLFKDGIEVVQLSTIPKNNAKEVLTLPNTQVMTDITKDAPIDELTWDADLRLSAEYVKYLEGSGYEVIRSVSTPDYIELVMVKGSASKRVLIFSSSLMVGDLSSGYVLREIESYFD